MEIGRKILNLRKDLGIPQNSLAQQSAITASSLSRIESGCHQPRGPVALRVARELGVTADYLLDPDAPYPPPAREVLANLARKDKDEPRDVRMQVSKREKRLILSVRDLEAERYVLLQATLDAPRDTARFAAFLVGAGDELPGVDAGELREYRDRLLASLPEGLDEEA